MKWGFDLILNSLEKDLNEKLTAAMFRHCFSCLAYIVRVLYVVADFT